MIEKLITPGQKIELTEILMVDTDRKPKTYQSQVFDVHEDDDRLDIAMPIVAGRLIPLSVGLHFSVCFYTPKGLYQSNCVIVDRYKSNNLYTIVIELKTAPKKYQRRQFYRLETILPLKYIQTRQFINKDNTLYAPHLVPHGAKNAFFCHFSPRVNTKSPSSSFSTWGWRKVLISLNL